jgi:hypothetical protein
MPGFSAFGGRFFEKYRLFGVIFCAVKFDRVCWQGEIAGINPEPERSSQVRKNFTFRELYLYLHQD